MIKNMKKYLLRCRSSDRDIFRAIEAGRKTIDTRAATNRYRNIAAGDVLIITCGPDRIEKTVKKVERFSSVEELLKKVPFVQINPDAKSTSDLYKMYASFPGYQERFDQYGILAFYI
jgi:ASC-1-like (ASCH) protein